MDSVRAKWFPKFTFILEKNQDLQERLVGQDHGSGAERQYNPAAVGSISQCVHHLNSLLFHFITSSCHSVFEGCLHDTSSHWRLKTITICKWLCIVSYGGLWNFIILFEISYTWHSRRLFINLYFFNLYPYSFWLHIKALDRWIECKIEERLNS